MKHENNLTDHQRYLLDFLNFVESYYSRASTSINFETNEQTQLPVFLLFWDVYYRMLSFTDFETNEQTHLVQSDLPRSNQNFEAENLDMQRSFENAFKQWYDRLIRSYTISGLLTYPGNNQEEKEQVSSQSANNASAMWQSSPSQQSETREYRGTYNRCSF